jgi:GTP cyclohydrolase IB
MKTDARFLVDVGMKDLPFPMRVASKVQPEGQQTVANISISARIMQEFEPGWIDRFIQVLHEHRDRIGTETLRANIGDYVKRLNANTVRVDFDYPFFMEKRTPVSGEKCLVRYLCTYSAKTSSVESAPALYFAIRVPAITTYPVPADAKPANLFAQLSIVTIEVQSRKDVFPEDMVDLVDRCALMPVYSFLTKEDQEFVIQKAHSAVKTSVLMTDEIKNELRSMRGIEWYSVKCSNFGMLHSYSTFIGTEKSMWVPFSGNEDSI